MIDIHCHVLPGVDDGADTPEIAGGMLECGTADGTATAVLSTCSRMTTRRSTACPRRPLPSWAATTVGAWNCTRRLLGSWS